ncbi:hypothetical protein [Thiomonas arsenitoxydans]|uniref:hypothetical protein n=1 Tax=Thiomonas arsenitoxydans (strain DSM 22701 / CIP 110005 / 3As) TaxID=426114 RepID=UPI0023F4B8F8|nr:hypothetical protein [Thiomonas arsenitoxydans]
MTSSRPPSAARTNVPPPHHWASPHFARTPRRTAELDWTAGLDLQRAWWILPVCPRRAAPTHIP